MSNMFEEIKKAVLECNHEMCSLCIIKWLNEDHTCQFVVQQ